MSRPWWERAKARVRRLGTWKWRNPAKNAAQVKRLQAKKGKTYVRPTFYAEEE